ncbi:hypothetical protein [Anaerococcus hydrogenalis]|uniref:Uncharacterized protein n=1 Tax=Anaerococcus hydrogenalis TaxID=33029 RepID=A0A2N6UJH6_9FIRM|nr:hypothetical protein [Anaerococcus hydrogenalis]MDK7695213.1 hypothetical protein [Anaerococcus hydrogenalis]MDK7696812.1 hypothetical protein [Anaerococcus hydrogenalis]MDK7708240.1 hypothetical protein [Anaerococcus hydrogenalis]PMC81811.1 hypothetical protein CJ192_03415 [Anaerococcus hydrogenalis]
MLKGKSVIELTNVNTNEKETYEDENLVTNAVRDLLSLNPSGLMYPVNKENYYILSDEIFPIANKCYGGILLFEDRLEEDANKYFADASNPITGYASNNVNTTDEKKRGSANLVETMKLENGYKFIWDFSTSQANGKISSLALTHYLGGKHYYGDSQGSCCCEKLNMTQKVSLSYDCLHSYLGIVEYNVKENTIISIWPLKDKSIEILKIDEPISSIGLSDEIIIKSKKNIEKTTIKIDDFYKNIYFGDNCYVNFFDGEDGYYYGFISDNRDNKSYLNRVKIKKDDYSFKIDYWTLDGIEMFNLASYDLRSNSVSKHSVVRNGYLYALEYGQQHIIKININNPADISKIDLYEEYTSSYGQMGKVGDFIFSRHYIVDKNDQATVIKDSNLLSSGAPLINVGVFCVGYDGSGNDLFKELYLHTPYLGTINNLSSPILKTADKTMKITYTLTEEE